MATTTAIRSPADAVNASLVQIGRRNQIGNLWDGSAEAQLALAIYGQTRDALLRSHAFDFAQRTIVLTLLKSAPPGGYIPGITPWDPTTYPPLPWRFEMAYPDDCIKIRAIKPVPIFSGPNFDPNPNTFTTANDNTYTPGRQVILTNLPNAVCIYTAQVTDLMVWTDDAKGAFIAALGEALAPALTSLETAKLAAAQEQQTQAGAEMEQG